MEPPNHHSGIGEVQSAYLFTLAQRGRNRQCVYTIWLKPLHVSPPGLKPSGLRRAKSLSVKWTPSLPVVNTR
jgi:hypothetical protein